jgi:hypothetical protein
MVVSRGSAGGATNSDGLTGAWLQILQFCTSVGLNAEFGDRMGCRGYTFFLQIDNM